MTLLNLNKTFFFFWIANDNPYKKVRIIGWFKKFKRTAIYEHVLLLLQRYDFITETETPENLPKNQPTKGQIITCYL